MWTDERMGIRTNKRTETCMSVAYTNAGATKQEAHRPWLAHLSEIATANMQMLCNVFPVLSWQLMKGSSSEQSWFSRRRMCLLLLLLLFYHIWA